MSNLTCFDLALSVILTLQNEQMKTKNQCFSLLNTQLLRELKKESGGRLYLGQRAVEIVQLVKCLPCKSLAQV